MSKNRFVLNKKGVRELLQSSAMGSIIRKKAGEIQVRCGDGYISNVSMARTRVHGIVLAETEKARRDNSKNNTILKAVRG